MPAPDRPSKLPAHRVAVLAAAIPSFGAHETDSDAYVGVAGRRGTGQRDQGNRNAEVTVPTTKW